MITSVQNTQVKNWTKLKMKKYRLKANKFLIEGEHLVTEAHNSNWNIVEIIIQNGTAVPDFVRNYTASTVTDNVFHHITDTKTPQGIAAVVEMVTHEWMNHNKVLMLDAIQDPGNLGTIIRTADAVGFEAVIIGNNSVDVYNDKVVRSTQGSLFHIPVYQEDLLATIPKLQKEGFSVWATSLDESRPYKEINLSKKIGLLLGNEGNGVDKSLIQLADYNVKIPIYGKAESLNVSVAAGILMYHIIG